MIVHRADGAQVQAIVPLTLSAVFANAAGYLAIADYAIAHLERMHIRAYLADHARPFMPETERIAQKAVPRKAGLSDEIIIVRRANAAIRHLDQHLTRLRNGTFHIQYRHFIGL